MSRKHKDRFRLERRDIMGKPDEEKLTVYDEITNRHLTGVPVKSREHRSGFPAITVDCGDIHILTDCLSVEAYWHKMLTFLKGFKDAAAAEAPSSSEIQAE